MCGLSLYATYQGKSPLKKAYVQILAICRLQGTKIQWVKYKLHDHYRICKWRTYRIKSANLQSTIQNTKAYLSIHTASPFAISESLYLVGMHFLWHEFVILVYMSDIISISRSWTSFIWSSFRDGRPAIFNAFISRRLKNFGFVLIPDSFVAGSYPINFSERSRRSFIPWNFSWLRNPRCLRFSCALYFS